MANPATPPSGGDGASVRKVSRDTLTAVLLVFSVLAAAFVATALSTQPAPSGVVQTDDSRRDPNTCDLGSWPDELGGPHPALAHEPSPGVYFWVDATVWHVRNVSGAPIDLEISMISRPSLVVDGAGSGDAVESEPAVARLSLGAAAPDYEVDLNVACEVLAMTFRVAADGTPVAANQLLLGRTLRADANPFLVERVLGG
jgi:hypothetical protein